jgi:proline iminopeptidase
MEQLRELLSIRRWVVFGGSWGSTLALAYAEEHPMRVKALILRGIFTGTKPELEWLYQEGGASQVFPEFWEQFEAQIPKSKRHNMVAEYYKLLTHKNPDVRLRAAKAWSIWEGSCSKLHVDQELIAHFADADVAIAIARIECHYFMNNCFFRGKNQLLRRVGAIQRIPGVIVQGRYDMVCPKAYAESLHRVWKKADYIVVPDAGHSRTEPGIRHALVEAADRFSTLSQ